MFIWIRLNRDLYGVCILIKSSDLSNIRQAVEPFFKIDIVEKRAIGEWSVYPYGDMYFPFNNYEEIFPYIENNYEPKRKYIFNSSENAIGIIFPEDNSFRVQIAIRLCRDIIKHLFLENTICYFHGGMVKYKNKGICVMGGKKSGKTSTILALLSTGKAGFISNDDLSVTISKNKKLMGIGWPRAVSIRRDAIENMSNILNKQDFTGIMKHPDNKIKELSDSCFVYVSELSNLFNCTLLDKNKIDFILFPEFWYEEKTEIYELDEKEKLIKLRENLELDVSKYFHDFKKYFFKTNSIYNKLEKKIKKVRMFSIKQNNRKMNLTLDWIDRLVQGE